MINGEKFYCYPLPLEFETKLLPQGRKKGGAIKVWGRFMTVLRALSNVLRPVFEQASFVDYSVVQTGGQYVREDCRCH